MTRPMCRQTFAMVLTITLSASMLFVTCDNNGLNVDELRWEERSLFVPRLSKLANAIFKKLTENYAQVSVRVVYSPDLTKPPFNLASMGLSGSPTILDIGTDLNLFPTPNFTSVYNLVDIARRTMPKSKVVSLNGAGTGPFKFKKLCGEGIFSAKVDNGSFISRSRFAYINPNDENEFLVARIPSSEETFSILGNFFASEGKSGKVIRVKVKKRIGKEGSFVTLCRNAVIDEFGNKTVGVGGVFAMKSGQALHLVQPNYTTPIDTAEALQKWTRVQNITAPLVSIGSFVTDPMGLDFRPQHFHSFSNSKGGHYFNDTSPDTVEYEAIFNVAERIIRVDRPLNGSSFYHY